MPGVRLTLLATGACVAAGALAWAAAPAIMLHVSPGLWQITNNTHMVGMENMMAGDPELAHMSPQMRARMQAAMAGMNGAHTSRSKTCVTQKDLEHPFRPDMDEAGVKCNYDVLSASATAETVHVVCTGQHNMDGTFHFMSPTPTAMNGHIDMKYSERGRPMTISIDVTGQWLGSDCGKVKSYERD